MVDERTKHWRKVWSEKPPEGTSWFQNDPVPSLEMIGASVIPPDRPLIDIGGGASVLVDRLVASGWTDLTVLDIASEALAHSRERLGKRAAFIQWVAADITNWFPERRYAIWHDRAVFHFLTDPADRSRYAAALRAGLARDGQVIIATFAPDGPEKCSGLAVQRYDPPSLIAALGGEFELIDDLLEEHATPWGNTQRFYWSRFRAL